ncbi:MAG: hydrolase [Spirochaetales bacterium]
MRVLLEHAQGLLVDVQERLLPAMDDAPGLLARTVRLVKGLQMFGVGITVSEQYPKGLGPTVPELAALLSGPKLAKRSFSCFDDEGLKGALAAAGRPTVILFGIEAHVCLLQTALDLAAAGYHPVVIADAVASRRTSDRDLALARLRAEGITVTSSESLLFELCRTADHPQFKALSNLVKAP